MAERQHPGVSTGARSTTGVRRNLFHHHLSRRPTTASTSTSAETLRLDVDPEIGTSDIVIRDKNGEFDVGEPPVQCLDDEEEAGESEQKEDEKLLEAVKASLRGKVGALPEDNWMYEAEEDPVVR
ncbi:hypothetical protein DH86_00002282 [Scytalidium sp. 3C]|nr:hypothetical protein DH86_00002282 [Scytalidium sp. 3C]